MKAMQDETQLSLTRLAELGHAACNFPGAAKSKSKSSIVNEIASAAECAALCEFGYGEQLWSPSIALQGESAPRLNSYRTAVQRLVGVCDPLILAGSKLQKHIDKLLNNTTANCVFSTLLRLLNGLDSVPKWLHESAGSSQTTTSRFHAAVKNSTSIVQLVDR